MYKTFNTSISAYLMLFVLAVCTIFCAELNAQTVTVSGIVTANQVPVSGAILYINGSNKSFRSRSGGVYSITVPGGPGAYTISVLSKSRLVAPPVSKVVNVGSANITNLNFDLVKAAAAESVIYGRITSRKQSVVSALEGVNVRIAGIGNSLTDKNGIYSFDKLKAGRYYLAATDSKYTFSSLKRVLLRSEKINRVDISGTAVPSGATYSTSFPGLYDFAASKKDTTCKLDKEKLNGVVSISQLNDKVTLRLPVLGTVSGKAAGSKFTVQMQKIKAFCRLTGTITSDFPQIDKGDIQGDTTIKCLGQAACTLSFVGTLSRK